MEADWEFEVGGGAPVIEADWPGFVDLRLDLRRVAEIQEATAFPPLAVLLQRLNGDSSPLWTAKCDLWEPLAEERAAPREENPMETRAERSAEPSTGANTDSNSHQELDTDEEGDADSDPHGNWAKRTTLACYLDLLPISGRVFAEAADAEAFCREWVTRLDATLLPDDCPDCRVELVIRQAVAGAAEGFGVTVYLSAEGDEQAAVRAALAAALEIFAETIPRPDAP